MLPTIIKRNKKYTLSTEPGTVVFRRVTENLYQHQEKFATDIANESDADVVALFINWLIGYLPEHKTEDRVNELTILEGDTKRLKISVTTNKETAFVYLPIEGFEPKIILNVEHGDRIDFYYEIKKATRHLGYFDVVKD